MKSFGYGMFFGKKVYGTIYKKRGQMKYVCRIEFDKSIDSRLVEQEIIESILTTEDVFGQAKTQLSASYLVSENKAVIDVSNEVGEHIFSVLTGRLNRKIGRERYSFHRVKTND